MDLTPTPSQTVGPYLHLGCTQTHSVPRIASPEARGEHLRLVCRVTDGQGNAVNDAMIEIWQADADGRYKSGFDASAASDPQCGGFGRMSTDEKGECCFETIKPGRVAAEQGIQAPHLNVSVFARGILKRLATRIYFEGDPANGECPILALVPQERRRSLLAWRDPDRSDRWLFHIRLSGADETVFFDV
ncbi:MAG TPA: protocatechuate 3,4-dioxygenase subunit alpha [Candidatus Binatia bacterium]|nr:protocatechuate 3,4-dioxygenase subunit alpha [Candidatus Binatia bacterium]